MGKNANIPKLKKVSELLSQGTPSPMPQKITPMLATLTSKPFNSPDWLFEVKWDGYRTLAFVQENNAILMSRKSYSFTSKYFQIKNAFEALKINAVFDGEIIVQDPDGRSNFNALQNWNSENDGELVMYVFDLLWYEGINLMNISVVERKAILKEVLPENPIIKMSESFNDGEAFFHTCAEFKLEGIMAKKKNSIYKPGDRSKNWLKIKCNQFDEFYIGGYTINEGLVHGFSSLLLGTYENGILKYVGKVGSGLSSKLQVQLLEIFKLLLIPESPFHIAVDVNKPTRFNPRPLKARVFWLQPVLQCQVSYSEFTNEGILRHPSFKGLFHK